MWCEKIASASKFTNDSLYVIIIHRAIFSFAPDNNQIFFQIARLMRFNSLTWRYENVTCHSLDEFRLLTSKISICIFVFFNLYRSVKKQALRDVPLTNNLNIFYGTLLRGSMKCGSNWRVPLRKRWHPLFFLVDIR